jgi:hypothetical protein
LGLDATDDINNFVAGFGDAGTFGLSRYLRERAGCNATTFFGRSVNSGSGFYTGGEATLTTASLVTGGAGLVKSGFKFGAKQLAKGTVKPLLLKIAFKNSHYAPRLLKEGVNVAKAEAYVAGQVAKGKLKGDFILNGLPIRYRAFLLPDGSVNVGTIFKVQ